jgi:hypothetical protein
MHQVDDFTLILTKGVHLISTETALAICAAVEEDARTVEVVLDPFCDSNKSRMTMIAVRHVVAITRNSVHEQTRLTPALSALKRTTRRT